ncbi:small ribosomal subunit protein mS40 [Neosynchiropus ocellatus]
MATSMRNVARLVQRISPSLFCPLLTRQLCLQRVTARPWLTPPPLVPPIRPFCNSTALKDDNTSQAVEEVSRYQDKPWEYLESEEYTELYGSNPVWTGYRRNHKGGIPPQKTRKTCIRGGKTCGNPCPVCRDPNIIIHHQNVKLLQQFISPHTGVVYDPTRTGVCMKQQKRLNLAINMARDHGLLPFQITHVDFTGEVYSNSHDAVGFTHPPPLSGQTWYKWYGQLIPDERELAKIKKLYKPYLK